MQAKQSPRTHASSPLKNTASSHSASDWHGGAEIAPPAPPLPPVVAAGTPPFPAVPSVSIVTAVPADLVRQRGAATLEAAFIGCLREADAHAGVDAGEARAEEAGQASLPAARIEAPTRRKRVSLGRAWSYRLGETREVREVKITVKGGATAVEAQAPAEPADAAPMDSQQQWRRVAGAEARKGSFTLAFDA